MSQRVFTGVLNRSSDVAVLRSVGRLFQSLSPKLETAASLQVCVRVSGTVSSRESEGSVSEASWQYIPVSAISAPKYWDLKKLFKLSKDNLFGRDAKSRNVTVQLNKTNCSLIPMAFLLHFICLALF